MDIRVYTYELTKILILKNELKDLNKTKIVTLYFKLLNDVMISEAFIRVDEGERRGERWR